MFKLIVFALVFAGGIAPAASTTVPSAATAQSAQDRLNFEAGMLDSAGGPVFRAIKRLYPRDYDQLIDEQFAAAAPHLGNKQALLQAGEAVIGKFFQRKMPAMMNAPESQLVAVNTAQLNLVKALEQGQSKACASYVNDGSVGRVELPSLLSQKMMAVTISMLEAAKAGEGQPARTPLDDETAAAWMEKVAEVEPSPQIRKLLEDDTAESAATPAQTCRLGKAIYGAIARLPAEQAARMTASLLQAFVEPASQ